MKLSSIASTIAALHTTGIPLFLWGQPGIGKSDVVGQGAGKAAKSAPVVCYDELPTIEYDPENAFGLFDVRMSQCEPIDIRGLPVPDSDMGCTKWLPPDWLPHGGRTDLPRRGILFLDEANGAPPSVQAAMYQLVLDRRIGNFALMPGWTIVLAGNRLTDGGVTFRMPKPLANRLVHIDVELDFEEWITWAIAHNLPPEVIAFLRLRPDLLSTFEDHVKEKRAGEAFATPRTWAMAGRIVNMKPPTSILIELLNGTLSKGVAAELFGFMQVWQSMPSIDGILLDPHGAPVPTESATLFAVATALGARATTDSMDAIVEYISRVPAEFSVLTIKDAQRRNPKCLGTAAFQRWANKNSGLLG